MNRPRIGFDFIAGGVEL